MGNSKSPVIIYLSSHIIDRFDLNVDVATVSNQLFLLVLGKPYVGETHFCLESVVVTDPFPLPHYKRIVS